jgi:mono/diheme cytochrome c family protein
MSNAALILIGAGMFGAAAIAPADERMTREEATKLKSAVPYSKKSIAAGMSQFRRNCTACHGQDGKSQVDVVSDATDLTVPKYWKSGITEGEIYRSIHDGAGETMPAFKTQMSDTDTWHLVNYIRSLWPESERPPLQDK